MINLLISCEIVGVLCSDPQLLNVGDLSEELPGHDHLAQPGPVQPLLPPLSLAVVSGSGGPVLLLPLRVSGSEEDEELEQNLNTSPVRSETKVDIKRKCLE